MAIQVPTSAFRAGVETIEGLLTLTAAPVIFVQPEAPSKTQILSYLQTQSGEPLTAEDISFLLSLRYQNGTEILGLDSDDSIQALTEIASIIEKYPWTDVRQFFSQNVFVNLDSLIRNSPINKPIFDGVIEEQNLEIVLGEGVEGFGECKKCGNKKLALTMKQTRSADEPTTAIYRCVECQATGNSIKLL